MYYILEEGRTIKHFAGSFSAPLSEEDTNARRTQHFKEKDVGLLDNQHGLYMLNNRFFNGM